MEMPLVMQIFSHKPKNWTNSNFDRMMLLHEKSEYLQRQGSSSGDHECTKLMAIHLIVKISQKTLNKNANFMVALGKRSGNQS